MKPLAFIGSGAAKAGAVHSLWTFPAIVGSSMMIAWAAESAQFFISQGLSLAILAWVQTLPEFAIEAVIAWNAPKMTNGIALVSANLTGSLRLLVGLGWPMIYGTAALFHRKKYRKPLKEIKLEPEHSVEIIALLLPLAYFLFIVAKGTLSAVDGLVLFAFYVAYLLVLKKIPPKEQEEASEAEWPIRRIVAMAPWKRNFNIGWLFAGGALIIYFSAEPFLHSMLALAVSLGVSQYVFVQWVAPFLSEFPEKLSAFYWARKITHAPMALMNMVSSNINQWTMLAGMIPFVYAWSAGAWVPLAFDEHQRWELLLTIAQSALGFCLLVNMTFAWHEAALIFALWLIQFIFPDTRIAIAAIYGLWTVGEVAAWLGGVKKALAFSEFGRLFRERVIGVAKAANRG